MDPLPSHFFGSLRPSPIVFSESILAPPHEIVGGCWYIAVDTLSTLLGSLFYSYPSCHHDDSRSPTKDPHSPSVLRVQRVVEGEINKYTVQEDVEQAIQRECEVRFSLAHSAPIMNLLLGEKLQYLSDEALAKAIITGTYDIPSTLDPATAMILKEIGKLGIKIVNGDSIEIIITPEDFAILEESQRVHIIVNVGCALWAL